MRAGWGWLWGDGTAAGHSREHPEPLSSGASLHPPFQEIVGIRRPDFQDFMNLEGLWQEQSFELGALPRSLTVESS